MLHTISFVLVSVLIAINIRALYQIVKGKISSFHPYSLFSLTVLAQLLPQLYVIFNNDFYSKDIIPNLLIMMIACQLAFKYGLKKGTISSVGGRILDFNGRSMKWLLFIFAIAGVLPMMYYASLQTVYGGLNVVLAQLRTLGMIALIMSLNLLFIKGDKSKKYLWVIAALSFLPLFYYGYFVKGSRQTLFSLFYVIVYFVLYFKPYLKRMLSVVFLMTFLFGNILSASMTEIRRYNNYHEDSATSLYNIKYWDNFKASLTSPDLQFGMDLGNGAQLIDYVWENDAYDYGATIWNGFVYNYIPQRIIGESNKDAMRILKNKDMEKKINNTIFGITYVTAYFDAFRMFSFLGFLFFFWSGYIIGRFELKSKYSTIYSLLFLMTVLSIPNMITGGIQYFMAQLEMLLIILMPIWIFYINKKQINKM